MSSTRRMAAITTLVVAATVGGCNAVLGIAALPGLGDDAGSGSSTGSGSTSGLVSGQSTGANTGVPSGSGSSAGGSASGPTSTSGSGAESGAGMGISSVASSGTASGVSAGATTGNASSGTASGATTGSTSGASSGTASGATTGSTSGASSGTASGATSGTAPACTNVCTSGGSRCGGGGTQSCQVQANGCTAWTNLASCSTGLVCESYAGPVCLDPNWAEWPMPNAQVDVTNGAPNLESYTDNGDGTVTDNVTGLMWQQSVESVTYTQPDALAYCAGLSLAGYTDWRLPTVIEVISIVDPGASSPALNTKYFPAVAFWENAGFWTSTLNAGMPGSAWDVAFSDGETSYQPVGSGFVARCVR
jgi:Protein of unknown function (DUF1566)